MAPQKLYKPRIVLIIIPFKKNVEPVQWKLQHNNLHVSAITFECTHIVFNSNHTVLLFSFIIRLSCFHSIRENGIFTHFKTQSSALVLHVTVPLEDNMCCEKQTLLQDTKILFLTCGCLWMQTSFLTNHFKIIFCNPSRMRISGNDDSRVYPI
jgi:hypothetical protein